MISCRRDLLAAPGLKLGRKTQFGMRARFATQKLYGVAELATENTWNEINWACVLSKGGGVTAGLR